MLGQLLRRGLSAIYKRNTLSILSAFNRFSTIPHNNKKEMEENKEVTQKIE